MPLPLTASTKLLFIGDSITDCGWRDDKSESIGQGYVRIVRDYLSAKDPTTAPTVINRGISGNKIPDLESRWQRDVLDLSPDILSIYIGINDVWHAFAHSREGSDIKRYTSGYRDILNRTTEALPMIKIVLVEPSVLWLPEPPGANERLLPYVKAVHLLAAEFKASAVVPLHAAFNEARTARHDIAWTTDGVHPTSAGHMLIAQSWLQSTGLL